MFIFSFSSSPPGVSCCLPFQLELFSFLLVLFSPVSRIPVMCLNCGFHVIQTAGWFLQVGFFKSPKVFFSTVCFSLDLFFFCPVWFGLIPLFLEVLLIFFHAYQLLLFVGRIPFPVAGHRSFCAVSHEVTSQHSLQGLAQLLLPLQLFPLP